ncbi:hypothetical protein AB4Y32_39425 [Paraburkholderia phymatum]|uniref:Uncharacterized protein n=1 Tax=Paraburkholderia phymatum TaxID=148447 RepID=A0ACC6UDU7_9BURK
MRSHRGAERLEGKRVRLKSWSVVAPSREAGLEIGGQKCALHGWMR